MGKVKGTSTANDIIIDLKFEKPLPIECGKWYALRWQNLGPEFKCTVGSGGNSIVCGRDGVKFTYGSCFDIPKYLVACILSAFSTI